MPLAAGEFQAFTPQHYLLIGIFLAVAGALVVLGRSRRTRGADDRFDRAFAVAIVVVTVPSQLYQLAPWDFSLGSSLPLALCDFAWIVAAWALWTHHPVPTALIYYWGLTLTTQAIITPSLGEAFPDPRYFMFWSMHFLIVWSAVYLTFGLGLGPAGASTGSHSRSPSRGPCSPTPSTSLVDVNYGYLVRKPSSASLLDLLGPWPIYVFASLGVLLVGWALITWPWVAVRRRAEAAPGSCTAGLSGSVGGVGELFERRARGGQRLLGVRDHLFETLGPEPVRDTVDGLLDRRVDVVGDAVLWGVGGVGGRVDRVRATHV